MVPPPFKGPLELFNNISDVAVVRFHPRHIPQSLTTTPQKYIDNEEELQHIMEQLSARLVEVESILLESNNHDNDVVNSSQQLAEYVTIYAESTVSLTPMFAGWW
jgi:predicted metal-dependent hydrolase